MPPTGNAHSVAAEVDLTDTRGAPVGEPGGSRSHARWFSGRARARAERDRGAARPLRARGFAGIPGGDRQARMTPHCRVRRGDKWRSFAELNGAVLILATPTDICAGHSVGAVGEVITFDLDYAR